MNVQKPSQTNPMAPWNPLDPPIDPLGPPEGPPHPPWTPQHATWPHWPHKKCDDHHNRHTSHDVHHTILPSDFCTVYPRSSYFIVLKECILFMMGCVCVGLVGLESLMRPEDWLTETFPWNWHCYCHCPSVNIPQENTIPISTLHTYSQHTSSISVLLAMAYPRFFFAAPP